MTDTPTTDGTDTNSISTDYKILGEDALSDGAGVFAKNTASSGTPIGVEGAVPNTDTGYGLATPDDAKISGDLETDTEFQVNIDGNFNLFHGGDFDDGQAGSIVHGHSSNSIGDGEVSARGATIAGGGFDDGSTVEPNKVLGNFGTVSGGRNNQAGYDNGDPLDPTIVEDATVVGGRGNTASGDGSTVGGGFSNTASSEAAFVGGGSGNTAKGFYTTVGGGLNNTASAEDATVGGGYGNTAGSNGATVGGGRNNTASGDAATVPGGLDNVADGVYSLAAGRKAKTDGNDGAFVWGDSSDQRVKAGGADEFKVQAGGGAVVYSQSNLDTGAVLSSGSGSWSSLSTRTAKTNVDPVDPVETLAKVEQLDVSRWEYDSEEDAEHMGPMAEEFYDAFGLGVDEKHITGVDADGVALAAIQGLSQKLADAHEEIAQQDERLDEHTDHIAELETDLAEKDERIDDLERDLAEKDERIDDLEAEKEALRDETLALREATETLCERLAAVEERLATIDGNGASPMSADD